MMKSKTTKEYWAVFNLSGEIVEVEKFMCVFKTSQKAHQMRCTKERVRKITITEEAPCKKK